jgi:transposase
MGQHGGEAFVGLDVSKLHNAVAIADQGRNGEIRFFGEIPNTPEATRKLVTKLTAKYDQLHFCYEAGPTGYGLHRCLVELGQNCIVIAPSAMPRRLGDRVKTNRRDAVDLARLLRAGELTPIWVPDAQHEAMRDLVRSREAASIDVRVKRQQVSAMMLRHGRIYPGKKTWGARHRRWLCEQRLGQRASDLAFGEALQAVHDAESRQKRTEAAIEAMLEGWSLAPVVAALQALRGIGLVSAGTLMAELGDLGRFANPRQLMGYVGLVPSERSTGDRVRRGGITKSGNALVRRTLVEASWGYRHAPRTGRAKLYVIDALPKPVVDIAWKAQSRLCERYRKLCAGGKRSTVAATAIARELAALVWAIGQEVQLKA